MLSLRNVLFNLKPSHREIKDPGSTIAVAETVFAELEFQLKELEEYKSRKRRMENELLGRPDYSWLMDSKAAFKIPQQSRLEIEDMCCSINPDSVNFIFRDFRSLIKDDATPELVCGYMKFVLDQHLQQQSEAQSSGNKQSRSGSVSHRARDMITDSTATHAERNLRSRSAVSFRSAADNDPAFVSRSHSAPWRAWKFIRKGTVAPMNGECDSSDMEVSELSSRVPSEDEDRIAASGSDVARRLNKDSTTAIVCLGDPSEGDFVV